MVSKKNLNVFLKLKEITILDVKTLAENLIRQNKPEMLKFVHLPLRLNANKKVENKSHYIIKYTKLIIDSPFSYHVLIDYQKSFHGTMNQYLNVIMAHFYTSKQSLEVEKFV